jgi:hypothetical protein
MSTQKRLPAMDRGASHVKNSAPEKRLGDIIFNIERLCLDILGNLLQALLLPRMSGRLGLTLGARRIVADFISGGINISHLTGLAQRTAPPRIRPHSFLLKSFTLGLPGCVRLSVGRVLTPSIRQADHDQAPRGHRPAAKVINARRHLEPRWRTRARQTSRKVLA